MNQNKLTSTEYFERLNQEIVDEKYKVLNYWTTGVYTKDFSPQNPKCSPDHLRPGLFKLRHVFAFKE